MTQGWCAALMVFGISLAPIARGEMLELKLPTDTPEPNRVFQKNMARSILNGFLAGSQDGVTSIGGMLRFELDHVSESYREGLKACRNDQDILDLAALRRRWQANFLAPAVF